MNEPTVYLLHLDTPFGHAKHYLGWSNDLQRRLRHHANGTGAHFLARVRQAGIGWTLARTWPGASRTDERKLKNRGGASRICPICRAMGIVKTSGLSNITSSTCDSAVG